VINIEKCAKQKIWIVELENSMLFLAPDPNTPLAYSQFIVSVHMCESSTNNHPLPSPHTPRERMEKIQNGQTNMFL
jgi:hypothetical protein